MLHETPRPTESSTSPDTSPPSELSSTSLFPSGFRAEPALLTSVGSVEDASQSRKITLPTGRNAGPFFLQERVGKEGREFTIFKFRTMREGVTVDPRLTEQAYTDGPMGKMAEDPRVTRIGKFMRRYGIDELPQLLNVIKGDMAFVGVRPMPREELNTYPGSIRANYIRVKPGFFNILYSQDVRGMEERIAVMEEFLRNVQAHPFRTKFRYLQAVVRGFLFHGRRGV